MTREAKMVCRFQHPVPESPSANPGARSSHPRSPIRFAAGVSVATLLTASLPAAWGSPQTANLPAASAQSQQLAQATELPGRSGTATLAAVDSDLYVLGPGDSLALTFLDPTATAVGGQVTILQDGTATLALLGSVQLTGLTIGQATRWLTSLYGKHLIRPQLSLSLTAPRPVKVSVIGEVQRPGLYALVPGATPVSAIQSAGGITLNSDLRRIMLRRRLPGPEANQKQTQLDLTELLTYGNQLQNPLLFDGDTIFVGRTEDPLPSEVLQIAATNLSPPSINVTVIGEVKNPGTLNLPANTSFAQAILRAGGPVDWRANRKSIELIRINRNGTASREIFNYKNPDSAIAKGFNPPLRDNDTIIVRRNLYGKTIDLVNQVLVPIGTATNLVNTYFFWQNWNDNNN